MPATWVGNETAEGLLVGLGAATATVLLAWVLQKLLGMIRHRGRLDVGGRWIVVTGCDSGFGQGVVAALSSRGAKVIACCLTTEGAERALSDGAKQAPVFDLTDEDAVTGAIGRIEAWCDGRLWGLVHNAGVVQPGFVDYLPLASYRAVMEVNFFAPVRLTRGLLPALRAARGRIVVVSSVDGLVSLPGNAPYDASKFAVEAWADALRVELSFWDVAVSVVNPSTMRTPMAGTFFEGHRRSWEAMQAEEPDGAWQACYPRAWLDAYVASNAENLERIAQDPAHAVEDVVHALTARHARRRYLSGFAAKTVFYALWVAPEGLAYRFKRAMVRPPPRVAARTGGGESDA